MLINAGMEDQQNDDLIFMLVAPALGVCGRAIAIADCQTREYTRSGPT